MKKKIRTYSGTTDPAVSQRELENRALARKAAAEGIVLLENNGVLPLAAGSKVALYGAGACVTMKGGTGSGDVNERNRVSIREGMENAGFVITSGAWLDEFEELYLQKRIEWRDAILKEQEETGTMFFFVYSTHPFMMPCGRLVDDGDVDPETKTAIFVLSRVAGEGADRQAGAGDYCMTEEEEALLASITARYEQVIVLLNAGGPVDLSFMDRYPIAALVQISQPGMEGGNAVADVLGGEVNPSGKLTDTWAVSYDDYPNAQTFSHQNGDVEHERYEEGIYVGYRYFDTFEVKPRYAFGYGLSYTTFDVTAGAVTVSYGETPAVSVEVTVKNTGSTAGREVVQVYASCPQGKLDKEYQRLCGFAKTPVLAAGETVTMTITFPVYQLASYSEEDSGWLLEAGSYALLVGNASNHTAVAARLVLDADHLMVQTMHICPLKEELTELAPLTVRVPEGEAPEILLEAAKLPQTICTYRTETTVTEDEAGKLAQSLSTEQKILLVVGDPNKDLASSNLGSAGSAVPGSAGETSHCAEEAPWNLAGIVLADGPAGLRLTASYEVDKDGRLLPLDFTGAVEGGFFAEGKPKPKGESTYYQYCTAFPIGTLLAQSWDVALIEEVGAAVAKELEEFGVTLWLAPGMNIHRNPLCGRNFEYYSEDPLLTGMMAAAMTRGVQTGKGVGTTIKHFACNNQEDNRMGSNSIVSERALREIYLRGFEIAVKTAQPMSVMTSYNEINGVHSANNADLLNRALRDEWGFHGVVMTDWMTTCHTTVEGGSSAAKCIQVGNDLIMPGEASDYESIRAALEGKGDCALTDAELTQACRNLINIVLQSLEYEDAKPYGAQFAALKPYVTVE